MRNLSNKDKCRNNLLECHNRALSAMEMTTQTSALDARTLLLDLVVTNRPPAYTVQQLLKAGEAFGIGSTAMRTALSRLTRDGQIEHLERGLYGIGPAARPLQRQLRAWHKHAAKPTDWQKDWLVAVVGTTVRTNRTVWRRTQRVLRLWGFAEAETNVWVRPGNIPDAIENRRQDMKDAGGSSCLMIIRATELDPIREAAFRALWDVPRMQAKYIEMNRLLEHSAAHLKSIPVLEAAAEALLLGRACIRTLNFDPALPEELCPSANRRKMTRSMIAYNQKGTEIWLKLLGIN